MEPICFTDEQRSLIEADVSTHLAACPGAGKTQAIVERFIARPAILGRRRGIALLSFTNAAVDEARSRCVGAPSLLASPNFVGTIDAFINRFIVAPLYTTRTKRPATFRDTWMSVPGTRITRAGIQGTFELSWFNLSPESNAMALQVMVWFNIISLFIWPSSFTLPNILRAAGDATFTMTVSVFSMWVFRVGFCYLMVLGLHQGNLLSIWGGMFLDWLFRSLFFAIRFFKGSWLEKKVI